MFTIILAGLRITIRHHYDYVRILCRDYIVSDNGKADVFVDVSEADIDAEQTDNYPRDYLESLAVYRKIADAFLDFDGFLLHGAAFTVDQTGCVFLAGSGTGKTTHLCFWKKLLRERCDIINGDKPIVRLTDNVPYIYGTPWAGKEGFQKNRRAPLENVCFIERSTQNECYPISLKDALPRLLSAVYLPKDPSLLSQTFMLLDRVFGNMHFYVIRCNLDADSARISYQKIFTEENKNEGK